MSDRHPCAHHPIFARLFDRASRVMELDVGPREWSFAVEPEPYLRRRALRAARGATVAVTVTVLAGVAAREYGAS